MEITYGAGVTTLNDNSLPVADAAISVTSSPFSYTNTSGNKQMVTVKTNGSTISSIARGRSGSLVATGKLFGVFILANNETLQVTYSAGTPVMRSQVIEGI